MAIAQDAIPWNEAVSANKAAARRILIYGINYAPEPIGVGKYTGEIGAYLAQQGELVDVITAVPHYPGWVVHNGYYNRYMAEEIDGTHVIRCPLFLRSKMGGIWRLMAPLSFALTSAPVAIWRILRTRPDAILCVEPTLFSAPIALLAAKLVGARTILHVQDIEIDAAFAVGHLRGGVLAWIGNWFERMTLKQFQTVVTISNRMRERLQDKGVPAKRLSVIRNWVNLEKIKPLPGHSPFRAELGLSGDDFVVMYSGNIGPKQAPHLILEAASRLIEQKQIVFIIAGEGPEKGKLLNDYGHLPNVRFLPLQPEDKLCEFLNLADVHVLPQLAGAADLVLPSKLGGMLASGKPCVVMADAGTEMYEFLGGTAELVPSGNAKALADIIKQIASGKGCHCVERQKQLAQDLTAEKSLPSLSHAILEPPRSSSPDYYLYNT